MFYSIVDSTLSSFGLEPREDNNNIRVRIIKVGPKEAKALLSLNSDNRNLRPGRVRNYAETMKNGEWRLTHQGIAFSDSGRGLDLQHRLHAVIQSGSEIPLMVTEGLSDEAFIAIDQHERRSAADALKKHVNVVEEAKFFISVLGGANAKSPTIGRVGEMVSEITAQSEFLRMVCSSKKKTFSSVGVRCAAILLMTEKHGDQATIADYYRRMVLRHTETWTPVMHAFNRQVDEVTGAHNKKRNKSVDLFLRSLVAFDPDKKNLTKIQLSANSASQARERVRHAFWDAGLDDSEV